MILVQRCIACVSTESKGSSSMRLEHKACFPPERAGINIERGINIPRHKMFFMDLFFSSVWHDLAQASKSMLVFTAVPYSSAGKLVNLTPGLMRKCSLNDFLSW